MEEMPKHYDPETLETKLIDTWMNAGYYKRSKGVGDCTVVIPPPNVTGVLHMGHALNNTIQDTIVRKNRMAGKSTRWILGVDHAGIATQTKVDKKLASEGISRHEIGREAFVDACYDWAETYGTTIKNQIKRMGSSCDFSDPQFTMGENYVEAVRKVFVDWYKDGLIYKGKRIVNWCPSCTTAIADDEVEHEDESGHLWHFRYPLTTPVNGIEYVIVATTRPETMLGDTGVAVNPKDERYADLVGATIELPLVGRQIPIFADRHVDPSFGTGCVKVTPSHDPNDWAMGEAHGLERINIFDEHAHVIEPAPAEFIGMTREEAREAVVARFEELGLLEKVEDHDHSVGHCYRCHTTLEPWESEQWFVDVEKLKGPATEVVEKGEITLHPARWTETYLSWMENLKDWCISRQLWWGHRIPVFYCDECGWHDALMEDTEVCPVCGKPVRQDEGVLDTWFSSQLWTFAAQGWPGDTSQLEEHHPTMFLSTAPDIIALWVARMIMSSLYFLKEIPFKDVVLHPVILAADGSRMSKSKGNGVDPVDLIAEYGADAMRFGLLSQVTGAQSIRFNKETMIAPARAFATKIWNASRFVHLSLEGYTPGAPTVASAADAWIFTRLEELTRDVTRCVDEYSFAEMARKLYSFFWNEFCDWYIEFSKARLQGPEREVVQRNLVFIMDKALRLLHPAMPFVTDAIWTSFPHAEDECAASLMTAVWPQVSDFEGLTDEAAEHAVTLMTVVASAVRATRARYSISPKQELRVSLEASAADVEALKPQLEQLSSLVTITVEQIGEHIERPAQSIMSFDSGVKVYVELGGLVDFDAERARIQKVIDKDAAELAKIERKLSNPGFLQKAKPEIIAKDRAKAQELKSSVKTLQEQLNDLA